VRYTIDMESLTEDKGFLLAIVLLIMFMIFFFFSMGKSQRENMFSNVGNGLGGTSSSLAALENEYPLITDEETCTQNDGEWKYVSHIREYRCIRYFEDGGNTCRSSDECQGICIVDKVLDKGEPIVGVCSPSLPVFGCYAEVGRYRITGSLSCRG